MLTSRADPTGMAAEGSRHGGQSWTEELLAQDEAGEGTEEEAPKSLSDGILYPTIERRLRSAYYQMVSCLLAPHGSLLLVSPMP